MNALELADWLETKVVTFRHMLDAAEMLRSQHSEIERLKSMKWYTELAALRAELAAIKVQPVELPRFPKELRKMWSGGDVQHWIDHNITPLIVAPKGDV